MDEILTVGEVAEFLKVSRTTVWRWCNQGALPAFKVGRSWRVHRSKVEKIIGESLEVSLDSNQKINNSDAL